MIGVLYVEGWLGYCRGRRQACYDWGTGCRGRGCFTIMVLLYFFFRWRGLLDWTDWETNVPKILGRTVPAPLVMSSWPRDGWLTPFSTAVLFGGQTSQMRSSLSPKRDCGPERVNRQNFSILSKIPRKKKKRENTYYEYVRSGPRDGWLVSSGGFFSCYLKKIVFWVR